MADSNEALAKAIIAGALIASGKFNLTQFDARGIRRQQMRHGASPNDIEVLIELADSWGAPGADIPALSSLRKLTDAIYRALG